MYEEDEKLITVSPIGIVDTESYIPVGTEVTFAKVIDNSDLSRTMIAFYIEDDIRIALETSLVPKDKKKIKRAFKETSKALMKQYPRLRRDHYNTLIGFYFKVHYFFVDLFGGKK